jgi:hypothetical protein
MLLGGSTIRSPACLGRRAIDDPASRPIAVVLCDDPVDPVAGVSLERIYRAEHRHGSTSAFPPEANRRNVLDAPTALLSACGLVPGSAPRTATNRWVHPPHA